MNKRILLISAMVLAIAACGTKDSAYQARIAAKKNGTKSPTVTGAPSTDATTANGGTAGTTASGTGAQPGLIDIKGAGAVTTENVLVAQIKAEQAVGKSLDGKAAATLDPAIATNVSSSITDTSLDSMKDDTNYVNLGCTGDQIDANAIHGLNELKPQATSDSMNINANVVLMCGTVSLPYLSTIIKADHIIMNAVDYSYKAKPGLIAIGTNKLTLNGASTLETIGMDDVVPTSASTIQLDVLTSTDGSGSLEVSSAGGNAKAAPAAASTAATSTATAKAQVATKATTALPSIPVTH